MKLLANKNVAVIKQLHSIKFLLIIFFSSLAFSSLAQEGTRATNATIEGKVMVIPFEPLMYMSEIDKKINEQTGWNFEQIRENFRHNLDVQLLLKLKTHTQAISFYQDSAKMAKDLDYIYKSRTLSYDLIDLSKTVSKAKQQKNITNGQLTVEINNDKKFMNAKIINPTLIGYLHKKYASTYFIFINELDIKNDLNSYDIATDTYKREITVHYTIMDKTAKIISAGVIVSMLTALENDPKKIVEKAFVPIDESIANKLK